MDFVEYEVFVSYVLRKSGQWLIAGTNEVFWVAIMSKEESYFRLIYSCFTGSVNKF